MANLTVPFEVSAAGAGLLGVSPPAPLGATEAAGVVLHAANTSIEAPASALSFRNFIQSPPHTDRPGYSRSISVGASSRPVPFHGPGLSSDARCRSEGSATSSFKVVDGVPGSGGGA
jgi:hypothetical protein